MKKAELVKVLKNVNRVAANRNTLPPDLTAAEKAELWTLVSALNEAEIGGYIYDTLRDAFEHKYYAQRRARKAA